MACKTEWLCEEPNSYYGAYLYEYILFNKDGSYKKGMHIYVGSKKGKFDINYDGSCKTNGEQFLEDLANYDYELRILAVGTERDMRYMETKRLHEADAKNNPDYYNESNLSGHIKTGYSSTLDKIRDMIENKEFYQENISKEEVGKLAQSEDGWWQVRPEEDPGHVKHCTDFMERDGEAFFNHYPTVVYLDDANGPGKPKGIGGKNTTLGSLKVRKIKTLPVIHIPKELWSKLDSFQIHDLAMGLNGDTFHPKETPIKELAAHLAKKCLAMKSEVNTEANRNELIKGQKCTKTKATKVIKKAENLVKERKVLGKNQVPIQWGDKGGKVKERTKIIAGIENESTKVIVTQSGMMLKGLKLIIQTFMDHPEIETFIILPWHGSLENKENWDNKYKPEYQKMLDYVLQLKAEQSQQYFRFDETKLEFTEYVPDPIDVTKATEKK